MIIKKLTVATLLLFGLASLSTVLAGKDGPEFAETSFSINFDESLLAESEPQSQPQSGKHISPRARLSEKNAWGWQFCVSISVFGSLLSALVFFLLFKTPLVTEALQSYQSRQSLPPGGMSAVDEFYSDYCTFYQDCSKSYNITCQNNTVPVFFKPLSLADFHRGSPEVREEMLACSLSLLDLPSPLITSKNCNAKYEALHSLLEGERRRNILSLHFFREAELRKFRIEHSPIPIGKLLSAYFKTVIELSHEQFLHSTRPLFTVDSITGYSMHDKFQRMVYPEHKLDHHATGLSTLNSLLAQDLPLLNLHPEDFELILATTRLFMPDVKNIFKAATVGIPHYENVSALIMDGFREFLAHYLVRSLAAGSEAN